MKFNSGSLFQL